MSSSASPRRVADHLVVTLDYELKVEGEVVDTSRDDGPIEFIQGSGEIIPGLETALYGLGVGESKRMVIVPADGYGEYDPDAFAEIPLLEFPEEIPLELGVELQLRDDEGDEIEAFIEDWDDRVVRLNLNHPLAGKTLHFAVTVVGLRQPTPEELEHGHVHGAKEGDEDE